MSSTKEQILSAAEVLFAEKGYDATGIREITRRAGVNLAAVHYHFGSKEELYLQMIQRHTEPLNNERLRLLEAALKDGAPDDARPIFAALVDPVHRFLSHPDGSPDPARLRLAGRVFVDISTSVDGFQDRLFLSIKDRFWSALRMVAPTMPEELVHARFYLAISTLMGTVILLAEAAGRAESELDRTRFRNAFDQVIAFVAAGFASPEEGLREPGERSELQ